MQSATDKTRMTIVGFFSEAWDAEGALEELNFAGFEQRIRYIENGNARHSDSSKGQGGRLREVDGFFARLYGFDSEEEYLDSRGNWTVSPEAEEYFTKAYERKHHVIFIRTNNDAAKAIEILHQHHGKVEEHPFAFFSSLQSGDDEHFIEGNSTGLSAPYHQTALLEPPVQAP